MNEPDVQIRRCARCQQPLVTGQQHDCPREKRSAMEAWHRQLDGGRSEILCRVPGYHLRVSAPDEEAWEAVEMFERWTGLDIQSERRPRRVKSPPVGQISMLDLLATDELESDGKN